MGKNDINDIKKTNELIWLMSLVATFLFMPAIIDKIGIIGGIIVGIIITLINVGFLTLLSKFLIHDKFFKAKMLIWGIVIIIMTMGGMNQIVDRIIHPPYEPIPISDIITKYDYNITPIEIPEKIPEKVPELVPYLPIINKKIQRYGFILIYPSSWIEVEPESDNIIFEILRDEMTIINVKWWPNDGNTQEEVNRLINSDWMIHYLESNGELNDIIIQPITIQGINTYNVTYFETVPFFNEYTGEFIDLKLKIISMYFVKDEFDIFNLNYISIPRDYDEYLDEAEKIIESFKIEE